MTLSNMMMQESAYANVMQSVGGGNARVGPTTSDVSQGALNREYVDPEKKVLRLLNQRYELKEVLGKGAHGQLYSGRDKVNKTPIAVKIVSLNVEVLFEVGMFTSVSSI